MVQRSSGTGERDHLAQFRHAHVPRAQRSRAERRQGNREGVLEGAKRDPLPRIALAAPAVDVAVVDINDFGGNILGSTLDMAGERRLVSILADNPLGQGHQSTPLGVVRLVEAE